MTKKFTAYDPTTGRVLFGGTASNPEVFSTPQIRILLGYAYSTGWIDDLGHHPLPPYPSAHHMFDWQTKQWVDPRILSDHQAAKWAQIKAARTAAINAPLTTPYGVFDAHDAARSAMTQTMLTLQVCGPRATVDFTLADNTTATLTAEQMLDVVRLLGDHVQAAHTHARALREQIDAATSPAELDAIDWIVP